MRRDVALVKKESAEPGPERPAAKQQERGNSSTSVETTGHLSVPAVRRISVEYDALFDQSIHPISLVAAARCTATISSTLIVQVCSHGRR